MGYYTPTLDNLLRNNFDIGLKDYPIFMEEHRETLNNKIIEHYRFREIGLETPMLFKLYLNRKMNEIMPYYNQLYESELLEFEPISNYEYHKKFDGYHKGNEQNTSHDDTFENKTSGMTKGGNENENKTERENQDTTQTEHIDSVKDTTKDTTDFETTGETTHVNDLTDVENDNETKVTLLKEDGTNAVNNKSWTKSVASDTPQGLLSGESWDDPITNNHYATNGGYTVEQTELNDRRTKTNESGGSETSSTSDTEHNKDTQTDTNIVENQVGTDDSVSTKSTELDNSYDKTKQYVDNEDYEHDINGTKDSSSTRDIDNTDDNLTHEYGYKNVSPSDLLNKYRDTFLNIDMMIVDELSELFMSIF